MPKSTEEILTQADETFNRVLHSNDLNHWLIFGPPEHPVLQRPPILGPPSDMKTIAEHADRMAEQLVKEAIESLRQK